MRAVSGQRPNYVRGVRVLARVGDSGLVKALAGREEGRAVLVLGALAARVQSLGRLKPITLRDVSYNADFCRGSQSSESSRMLSVVRLPQDGGAQTLEVRRSRSAASAHTELDLGD